MDFGATSFWNPQTLLPALANGSLLPSPPRRHGHPQPLMSYSQLGLNTKIIPPNSPATAPVDVCANHRALVRKAGSAAITLLKKHQQHPPSASSALTPVPRSSAPAQHWTTCTPTPPGPATSSSPAAPASAVPHTKSPRTTPSSPKPSKTAPN
ncbi:hypothetical protein BO85DRAFT_520741 [Aspergillus piperis CBS 112811]|uniref:Uncharacterized protein n=1 Tax=Aspergillus piperis CBS 112811 TaxID=1448313 RepID=A0A8G1R0T8_9EURO|nr:hypothetical protein BO85DRAFT_520741 [Aspergillus piperis CBS 112811]RAH57294.1 hypothetical protein BO85DRAFT_520741 [Aspergillus piperis CBS 112811]